VPAILAACERLRDRSLFTLLAEKGCASARRSISGGRRGSPPAAENLRAADGLGAPIWPTGSCGPPVGTRQLLREAAAAPDQNRGVRWAARNALRLMADVAPNQMSRAPPPSRLADGSCCA
jgi:hypothetical protein